MFSLEIPATIEGSSACGRCIEAAKHRLDAMSNLLRLVMQGEEHSQ